MNKIITIICNFLWWLSCFADWFVFHLNIKSFQKTQNSILFNIVRKNQSTEFGLAHNFKNIKTVTDFQKLPVSDYEDFEPYIEKIKSGENNVLTGAKIKVLEPTSGSSGISKYIPYNDNLKAEFQKGIKPWIFDLFLHNPQLFLYKSYWSISPKIKAQESECIKIGFEKDSEYLGGLGKFFLEKIIVDDIEKEVENIGLISIWSPTFLQHLLSGKNYNFKNLKLVSAWADGASKNYTYLINEYFPSAKLQPKGLISTECFTSFPLEGADNVLSYRSHFFEFKNENGEIFLANGLKQGAHYTLIVTTSGGLYRYNTHDIVEITGFYKKLPIIKFIGRDNNTSDFFGEKLSGGFVENTIHAMFKKMPAFCTLVFKDNKYILLIETEEQISANLLEEALEQNYHYKNCIELGQLLPAEIIYVKNGVEKYSQFYERQGIKSGDIKPKILDTAQGLYEFVLK